MVTALLATGSAGGAEIYNKDGNRLDLSARVDGLNSVSNNSDADADQSYLLVFQRPNTNFRAVNRLQPVGVPGSLKHQRSLGNR